MTYAEAAGFNDHEYVSNDSIHDDVVCERGDRRIRIKCRDITYYALYEAPILRLKKKRNVIDHRYDQGNDRQCGIDNAKNLFRAIHVFAFMQIEALSKPSSRRRTTLFCILNKTLLLMHTHDATYLLSMFGEVPGLTTKNILKRGLHIEHLQRARPFGILHGVQRLEGLLMGGVIITR